MHAIPKRRIVTALLILLTVFLIYLPSMRGDFLWDDDAYISQNTSLTTLSGLHDIWLKPGTSQQYYPVTFTVLWIGRHLWGLNPVGYHALNALLHGSNAILVGVILEGLGIPGAWISAWLFAVHPVQAESVAWMTELKNVLSTFFYLSSLFFLVRRKTIDRKNWLIALALFIGAVLSKSVAFTLPISFLLIDWWWHRSVHRKRLLRLSPFVLLGLAGAAYTAYYEHHLDRAQGAMWDFTFLQRIEIAGRAFWFYLAKLFYPVRLCFIYPKWDLTNPALGIAGVLAAAGLLVLAARGRGRWKKMPFACLLFFAISIAPALGFTSFYFMRFSYVADHFQYLPSLGIFTLVGWGISRFLKELGIPLPSPASVIAVFLLSVNLSLTTLFQSSKYGNSFRLWQNTLAHNPNAAIAHHNLGVAYAQAGDANEAVAHFKTAEAMDPTFPQTHLALAYFALHSGHLAIARHEYEEAFRYGLNDPQIMKDFADLPHS